MRAKQVCPTPGCPVLVERGTGKCPECKQQAERDRGTTTQRGYGREHQQARVAALSRYQPTDPCARCGEPLGTYRKALDLDHTDDRAGYLGLSHSRCNRATRRTLGGTS